MCNVDVKADDSQHIYLVDHAWTFRPENARQQLENYPGLLERMANLMDLEGNINLILLRMHFF